MSDEDSTVIRSVRKALNRERFPDDRRPPPSVDIAKWFGIMVAIGGGIFSYATLTSDVKTLQRDLDRTEQAHEKDMGDYLGWNKSISERLRELERQ